MWHALLFAHDSETFVIFSTKIMYCMNSSRLDHSSIINNEQWTPQNLESVWWEGIYFAWPYWKNLKEGMAHGEHNNDSCGCRGFVTCGCWWETRNWPAGLRVAKIWVPHYVGMCRDCFCTVWYGRFFPVTEKGGHTRLVSANNLYEDWQWF